MQDGGIELPMLAVSPVAGSATSSSRFWIVGSWPLFLGSGLSKSSYRQGSATPIFPRATSARCTLWSPGPCGMCQNDLHSAQTLVRGCVRGDGRGAARDRRPVRVHPERAHRERVAALCAGRSELKISATAFQEPSTCFFHTTTALPRSCRSFPSAS